MRAWHIVQARVGEAEQDASDLMSRYFFHLRAGESRANPDQTGQHLPGPEAARGAAGRIARQLLAWNLEPVPWPEYQIQVTDEADAVLFEMPLSEAGELVAAVS
jgi:hypothetical protein